jgi:hypothetical protein
LRWPTKVFTWFVGGEIEDLVADELTVLKAHDFELTVHPSDLLVRGPRDRLMQAYAAITQHLTFTKCYLTWSKEANEIEDRFERLLNGSSHPRSSRVVFDELREIARDMKQVKVSDKEWEVLLRIKLQTELELLRQVAGIADDDRQQAFAKRESELALDSARPEKRPQTKKMRGRSQKMLNAMAAVLGLITWLRKEKSN